MITHRARDGFWGSLLCFSGRTKKGTALGGPLKRAQQAVTFPGAGGPGRPGTPARATVARHAPSPLCLRSSLLSPPSVPLSLLCLSSSPLSSLSVSSLPPFIPSPSLSSVCRSALPSVRLSVRPSIIFPGHPSHPSLSLTGPVLCRTLSGWQHWGQCFPGEAVTREEFPSWAHGSQGPVLPPVGRGLGSDAPGLALV